MEPGGPAHASPGEVTGLLLAWRAGGAEAPRELFTILYRELRSLARAQLRRRSGGDPPLGATSLVHEAYLKLADHSRLELRDRGHFFALAARAMRQALVDHARRRRAAKRGGPVPDQPLGEGELPVDERTEELLALDEALTQLERVDPRLARLVEARFFAGLSVEETAEALELSPRTVKRDWQKARAVLQRELTAMGAP